MLTRTNFFFGEMEDAALWFSVLEFNPFLKAVWVYLKFIDFEDFCFSVLIPCLPEPNTPSNWPDLSQLWEFINFIQATRMTGLLVISFIWRPIYTSWNAEWPHTGCVYQSFGRQGVKWFLVISVNCKTLGLNKLFKGLFRFPHLILLPVFFSLFPVFSALVRLYSFSFGEVWKPITLTQGLKIIPSCPGKSCCI